MKNQTRKNEKSDSLRLKAVENLVSLTLGVHECIKNLSIFSWDYNGNPFLLERQHIEKILEKYLSGKISILELEAWADAIELRDDIKYELSQEFWIENVIVQLASPSINEPLNYSVVRRLMS
jgi:hypothetical protein